MAETHSDDLALIPRTRTVSRRRTKAGRYVADITYDELAECFSLPKEKAAERLGVGVTILKRICRRMNISRWPYRRDYHKPREYSGVSSAGDSDGDVEPVHEPAAALTSGPARRGGAPAPGYHHTYDPHQSAAPAYSPFMDGAWAVAALAAAGAGPAAFHHPNAPHQAPADLHRTGSAETEIISIGAMPGAAGPAHAAGETQGGLDLLLTAIETSGDGDADDAGPHGHSDVEGPAAPAPAPAPAAAEPLEVRLRRAIETNPEFAQLVSKVLQENAAGAGAHIAPPPPPQPVVPDATVAVEGQLRDELSHKFLVVQAELAARRQDLAHLETYISSRLHAALPMAQMAAALHAAQAQAAPVFGGARPAIPAASQVSSYLSSLPRAAAGWGGYPQPSAGFAPWGSSSGWGQQQ